MFQSAPSTRRAAAHVQRSSSTGGSGAAAIRVPGFARKFWTITSWTWPPRSPSARIARSASSREGPLPAAGRRPRARHLPDLVLAHVGPLAPPRRPREHAVAADVAAELRQRDEDLRGVGDEPAVTELPEPARLARQPLPRLVDELEGLRGGEGLTHGRSLRMHLHRRYGADQTDAAAKPRRSLSRRRKRRLATAGAYARSRFSPHG